LFSIINTYNTTQTSAEMTQSLVSLRTERASDMHFFLIDRNNVNTSPCAKGCIAKL